MSDLINILEEKYDIDYQCTLVDGEIHTITHMGDCDLCLVLKGDQAGVGYFHEDDENEDIIQPYDISWFPNTDTDRILDHIKHNC
ncbi:hypothetical protein WCWAEYFT_CDS0101 [Vibrio phage VB_VaC_TDDLMA]